METLKDLNLISILNNMEDEKLKIIVNKATTMRLYNIINNTICECGKLVKTHCKCRNCRKKYCIMFIRCNKVIHHRRTDTCLNCLRDHTFHISTINDVYRIETEDINNVYYILIRKYNNLYNNAFDKIISYKDVLKLIDLSNIVY